MPDKLNSSIKTDVISCYTSVKCKFGSSGSNKNVTKNWDTLQLNFISLFLLKKYFLSNSDTHYLMLRVGLFCYSEISFFQQVKPLT